MSKLTVIAATNNKNKLAEFRDIFEKSGISIISMAEAGIEVDPEENGLTIEENARIKARAVWELCHRPVRADDTGRFVDALGGAPGVQTARYAGEPQSSDRNIDKLLANLEGVPQAERSCRFLTAICYLDEQGNERMVHGRCEGWIGFERRGDGGFGYEPVFCLWNNFTLAELGREKKDQRSHRSRACHKLAFILGNTKKIRMK